MRAHVQAAVWLFVAVGSAGTAHAQGWAPTNLTANPSAWNQVQLSWTDRSSNELDFRIERRAPGGTFAQVGVVAANVTAYSDGATLPSTAYEYRVIARRSGSSAPSNVAATTTPAFLSPGPIAASPLAWDRVQVSWPSVTDAAVTAVLLQRRPAGGVFVQVASVAPAQTSVVDGSLTPTTNYEYRVVSQAGTVTATPSAAVSATTLEFTAAQDLAATAPLWNRVELSWSGVDPATTELLLERREVGAPSFSLLATLAGSATSSTDTSTMPVAAYEYRLVARAGAITSSPSNVATATTPELVPVQGLAAAAAAWNRVNLTWTDVHTDVTALTLERREVGAGAFVAIGSLSPAQRAVEDSGLLPGTDYEYRLVGHAGQAVSAPSNVVAATTPAFVPVQSLTATATSWNQVQLAWTSVDPEVDELTVEMRQGGVGDFYPLGTVSPTQSSFTDSTTFPGTAYEYRLIGRTASLVTSSPSNVATTTTTAFVPVQDLTATATSWNRVQLAWTSVDPEVQELTIEIRQSGLGDFYPLGTVSPTQTSFTDSTTFPGTAYEYRLIGRTASLVTSSPSNVATTTTPAFVPVQNLTATATAWNRINLTWTNVDPEVQELTIEARQNGLGDFYLVGTVSPTQTSFTDSTTLPERAYEYRLIGRSASLVTSSPSNVATATTPAFVPVENLTATATSWNRVQLAWTNVDPEVQELTIEARQNGLGDFYLVDTVSPTQTSFTDSTTLPERAYEYRLIGRSASLETSSPSNVATATTPAFVPVENLTATATAWNSITLTWANVDPEVQELTIETRQNGAGDFYPWGTASPTATTFQLSSALPETAFEFRIVGRSASFVTSSPSNVATATTPAFVPAQNLTASATAWNRITLTWTDVDPEVQELTIETRPTGVGDFYPFTTTSPTANMFVVSNASPATAYEFRIVGRSFSYVTSSPSNVATATTPAFVPVQDLTATATAWNSVTLAWTSVDPEVQELMIERRDGAVVEFFQFATTSPTATTFVMSTASPSTAYEFRIVGRSFSYVTSSPSNVATTTTPAFVPVQDLTATATAWNSVTLAWTSVDPEVQELMIERRDGAVVEFFQFATTSPTATTFVMSTASPATAYEFRIVGRSFSYVNSSPSNVATATTPAFVPVQDLTATATSWGSITLAWTNVDPEVQELMIERRDGAVVEFFQFATTSPTATTFVMSTASPATAYEFRIIGRSFSYVNSSPSNVATVMTPSFAAPQDLAATAQSWDRVQLTWSGVDPAAEDLLLQRREGGVGSFFTVAQLTRYETSTIDDSLTANTFYEYRLIARASFQESTPSNVASVTTPPFDDPALQPPSGLAGRALGPAIVRLTWTDNATGESYFKLQRSPAGLGTFQDAGFASANETSGLDQNASAATAYDYRVLAVHQSLGDSAPSNVVTVTTPAEPLIDSVAGDGTTGAGGDGGPATAAQFDSPYGLAVDAADALYVSEYNTARIRKIVVGGLISTLAPATSPYGVVVDAAGNVYVAERDASRVRRVDAVTGQVTTIAGTGVHGFNGDDVPAASAQLYTPQDVAVDSQGNLFIADAGNHRVRRVDAVTQTITTVAGTGASGFSGDGGPATLATLTEGTAITFGPSGDLLIVDRWNRRVRSVSAATGIITTVVGDGSGGMASAGGPAVATGLEPTDVVVDTDGTLYVSDASWHVLYRVDAQGFITRIAGQGGFPGSAGDGGAARQAQLSSPTGVVIDSQGNLFFVDSTTPRVRRITGVRY